MTTTPRWKQRPPGSNWGDFGADDQRGRMNLLTPAVRLRALQEVKTGKVFCLSLPLDYPGGSGIFKHRKAPAFVHEKRGEHVGFNYRMSLQCACFTDVVNDEAVLVYSQYSTQWDGLSHVGQMFDADGDGVPERVFYNGWRAGVELLSPLDDAARPGAHAIGIEQMAAAGVQGRGVLVDLESRHGRERVLVGYDGLMAALEAQRAEVLPGDFLCLYTGLADLILAMNRQPDSDTIRSSCAVLDGRDERLLQWVTDSGIVALCADNVAVEAYPALPGRGEHYPALPLHAHCLFKLGVHLGELWHFAELAKWLRAQGRWSFLLTAPPWRMPGAVGSPVTPLATV